MMGVAPVPLPAVAEGDGVSRPEGEVANEVGDEEQAGEGEEEAPMTGEIRSFETWWCFRGVS